MSTTRCHALVLAGERGPGDPVATAAGHRLKAFVPVAGVPMLRRVLMALETTPSIGRIAVCMDRAALDEGADPWLRARLASDGFDVLPPASGPSASVAAAIERLPPATSLLVTTADHPLLTAAMIDAFLDAVPRDADAAAAVVPATVLRRAYPQSRRTYWRFREDGYSGANLFFLRPPGADRAVAFWQRVDRHRKQPWRIALRVGPVLLLRFVLGRLSLQKGVERLSRRVGARLAAVPIPFAEAAIDVDRPDDLSLVETLLRTRESA